MNDITSIYLSLFKDKYFNQLDLTDKQYEALEILSDLETKMLAYGGGAGGGKSWLGCVWLLLSSLSYPGIKSFIGRESLKDITQSTLITFYKVCKFYGVTPGEDFKYNGQYNYIEFKNGSRIDLLQLKQEPSDPLYERFGSMEFTIGWIEEGGQIEEGAAEVLQTRIGRHYNDKYHLFPKLLITCNPKKNWLYTVFYKPFTKNELSKKLRFLQSLVTDNPKIESEYALQLQEIQDESQKQRLLFGNWDYEDTSNQLVTYQWLESVLTDELPQVDIKKMGVDVARDGNDQTIMSIWYDSVLALQEKINVSVSDQSDISGLIQQEITSYANQHSVGYKEISVDAVGVGAGVVDAFRRNKWFVNSYKGGEKVDVSILKTNQNVNIFENYFNLRSFSYWQFRIKCQNKQIKIYRNLKYIEELFRDFTAHTYLTDDKTIRIEEKESVKRKIGRSPDYSDAAVIGLSPQPKKQFSFVLS